MKNKVGGKMAVSYINTDEVENIAKAISTQVDLYNTKIENLFKRFADVPTVTGEWFGQQANYYFSVVSDQKNQYVKFGQELQALVDRLYSDVADVRSTVEEVTNKESSL